MIEQGTPEWIAQRLGKATASRMADIVAKTRTGWGASRANYLAELVAERLTGFPQDTYINAAMQWGLDHEAEAKEVYAARIFEPVTDVGFVPHPTVPMSGASPDALVGEHGLTEIKCPNTATHIDTLLGVPVAAKYISQMFWQMACTGRAWVDFVSYDPRLPSEMRLFVWRLERDDKLIADLEDKVREFLAEVDAKVAALTEMYLRRAA